MLPVSYRNKAKIFGIFTILIISFIINPAKAYLSILPPANDIDGSIFRPVNLLRVEHSINVIQIGNTSYLYLGLGVYYPLDIIMGYIYPNSSIKTTIPLDDKVYRFKAPIIIKIRKLDSNFGIQSLRDLVRRLGGEIDYVYKAFPLVSAKVPLVNVSKILLSGVALSVMPDYKVQLRLNESVPMILPPDDLRNLERLFGRKINGSGIVIGILDTGIDGSHPDFYFSNGTSKIVYNVSFVPGESPVDGFGHGTHVAGIAAGTGAASSGVFKGVAYGALIANIKVMSNNGTGYVSWILKGIEFAINQSIDIINLSLGGGYNGIGDDPLSVAVDEAFDKGIVVVVAAGNDGPDYSSLGTPAVARKAITVGAIGKNWSIADFSSRGPTGDNRVKPDVLAPGIDIVAPLAHGSFLEKLFNKRYPSKIVHGAGGDYVPLDGTSMAAPHVAGLAALILQTHPDFTPKEVKSVILSTANFTNYDVFTGGLGIVDGVSALNASVIFDNPSVVVSGGVGQYDISFRLRSLDGKPHNFVLEDVALYNFYSEPINLSSHILGVQYSSLIFPDGYSYINLSLVITNLSLYYGYVRIRVDSNYILSGVYSLATLPKVVLNITLDIGYVDGIFFAYNMKNPERVLLPSGYKYFDGLPFRYYVWFNLPPGKYVLFALGLNITDNMKNITGPLYIGDKKLFVNGDKSHYYLQFNLSNAVVTQIPISIDDELAVPYFVVSSFEITRNKSVSIYFGGTWDIYNDTRCIFSLESDEEVFLSIQYMGVPKPFHIYPYKGLDYIIDYYALLWKFRDNPSSLEPPSTATYTIDTSSLRDEDVMYGGLAVFPPHQKYTYIAITPFYQGGIYRIHVNSIGRRTNVGLVTLDKNKLGYRSATFFNPLTDMDSEVKILSPPYLPTFIVKDGVLSNGSIYLNITSALATSIEPTNVIVEGKSYQEIYFNDTLIDNSTETDDFDIHGLTKHPIRRGIYRVHSHYDLNYSLYSVVDSTVEFNTNSASYIPPILYRADLPVILSKGYRISFTFITPSEIKSSSIYISWDNGVSWSKLPVTITSSNLLLYTMVTLYAPIETIYNASPSIKVRVEDKYGNWYSATIYNFSSTQLLGSFPYKLSLDTKKFYRVGETVSINITSDGGLYGLPIYINESPVLNLLINGSGTIIIPNLYNSSEPGVLSIKIEASPNTLYSPMVLSETIYYSDAVYRGLKLLSGNRLIKSGEEYYVFSDYNSHVRLKFLVEWIHNFSQVDNLVVKLANGTMIGLKGGLLSFASRSYPTLAKVTINALYFNYSNVLYEVSEFKGFNLSIYWELVNISIGEPLYDRVQVNTSIVLNGHANYMASGKSFNGTLIVDGQEIPVIDGLFNISISNNQIGKYHPKVVSIYDPTYNISVYIYNTPDIIFDSIEINAVGEYKEGAYHINITLRYLSDGSPVYDAAVYVNGSKAIYIGVGQYIYNLNSDLDKATFVITVDKPGFEINPYKVFLTRERPSTSFSQNMYIIYILIIVVAIFAVVIYLKRKK